MKCVRAFLSYCLLLLSLPAILLLSFFTLQNPPEIKKLQDNFCNYLITNLDSLSDYINWGNCADR